jgi:hypothetical protein
MDRGYDFHVGNGTTGSADNGNVFAITNYSDSNARRHLLMMR